MLAKNEKDIPSFINRLNELRKLIVEKEYDNSSKLVLSTIHSSKGLEYDSVILMDVLNGVFPSKVVRNMAQASLQEKKDFEEERRIFYVGMTRAKENLTILQYKDRASTFIKELSPTEEKQETVSEVKSYFKAPASSYYKRMMSKEITQ